MVLRVFGRKKIMRKVENEQVLYRVSFFGRYVL